MDYELTLFDFWPLTFDPLPFHLETVHTTPYQQNITKSNYYDFDCSFKWPSQLVRIDIYDITEWCVTSSADLYVTVVFVRLVRHAIRTVFQLELLHCVDLGLIGDVALNCDLKEELYLSQQNISLKGKAECRLWRHDGDVTDFPTLSICG